MYNNFIGTFEKKIKGDCISEQQRLVLSAVPMASYLAHQYARKSGCSEDDLFQESVLGLQEAASRYDSNYKASFTTYSYFWIRRFILRFLDAEYQEHKHYQRNYGNESFATPQSFSPEFILLKDEEWQIILSALLELDSLQFQVIQHCFLSESGKTNFRRLACELNLSFLRVRRIYYSALSKLRQKCRKLGESVILMIE